MSWNRLCAMVIKILNSDFIEVFEWASLGEKLWSSSCATVLHLKNEL